jgi:hypothetical protein
MRGLLLTEGAGGAAPGTAIPVPVAGATPTLLANRARLLADHSAAANAARRDALIKVVAAMAIMPRKR